MIILFKRCKWTKTLYNSLGFSVGAVVRIKKWQRREQYACDITYGTNNEFGFDYLRDNMNSWILKKKWKSSKEVIIL